MGCGCKKVATSQYVWTNGTDEIVYTTEIQAKAKVMRSGGTYTTKPLNQG